MSQSNTITSGPGVDNFLPYTLIIGGQITAPTPGTVTINNAQWRRVGDSIEILYQFQQTAAGSPGSGIYLFPLPNGYLIDTAKSPVGTENHLGAVGSGQIAWNGDANTASITVQGWDTSNLSLIAPATGSAGANGVGSGFAGLDNPTMLYSFYAKVPIVDWT